MAAEERAAAAEARAAQAVAQAEAEGERRRAEELRAVQDDVAEAVRPNDTIWCAVGVWRCNGLGLRSAFVAQPLAYITGKFLA